MAELMMIPSGTYVNNQLTTDVPLRYEDVCVSPLRQEAVICHLMTEDYTAVYVEGEKLPHHINWQLMRALKDCNAGVILVENSMYVAGGSHLYITDTDYADNMIAVIKSTLAKIGVYKNLASFTSSIAKDIQENKPK